MVDARVRPFSAIGSFVVRGWKSFPTRPPAFTEFGSTNLWLFLALNGNVDLSGVGPSDRDYTSILPSTHTHHHQGVSRMEHVLHTFTVGKMVKRSHLQDSVNELAFYTECILIPATAMEQLRTTEATRCCLSIRRQD